MRSVETFLYRRLLMSGWRDVQGKRGKHSKMTSMAPFLQILSREEKKCPYAKYPEVHYFCPKVDFD